LLRILIHLLQQSVNPWMNLVAMGHNFLLILSKIQNIPQNRCALILSLLNVILVRRHNHKKEVMRGKYMFFVSRNPISI